jgi:Protein of unknown function (DUF2867)
MDLGFTWKSDLRLSSTAHTSRPWRIHEIAPDFRLEDVWALPTPGGPDDFPLLVAAMTSLDATRVSPIVRALFEVRIRLGGLLGWDRPDGGLGARVPTLRDRLPADLSQGPAGPDFGAAHFSALYETHDEFAAEAANRTMHGVLHLGWVPDDDGGYRGQLAVLTKPNGFLGDVYMAGIAPFRNLIVYPTMLREIGRSWTAERATGTPPIA